MCTVGPVPVPLHLPATVTHCLWPSAGITPPASKTLPECVLKRPGANGHHCQPGDTSADDRREKRCRGTAHITIPHVGGWGATTVRWGHGSRSSLSLDGWLWISFCSSVFWFFFWIWLQDHRSCPVLISPPAVAAWSCCATEREAERRNKILRTRTLPSHPDMFVFAAWGGAIRCYRRVKHNNTIPFLSASENLRMSQRLEQKVWLKLKCYWVIIKGD